MQKNIILDIDTKSYDDNAISDAALSHQLNDLSNALTYMPGNRR